MWLAIESIGESVPEGTSECWAEFVASDEGSGLAGVCAAADRVRQSDASRYLIMDYHYIAGGVGGAFTIK
jgi:hypothetical protein